MVRLPGICFSNGSSNLVNFDGKQCMDVHHILSNFLYFSTFSQENAG